MTKQSDRLTRVEDGVEEIKRTVSAISEKMDRLCDLGIGPIALHGRKLERHDTLFGFLVTVCGGILVAVVVAFIRMGH